LQNFICAVFYPIAVWLKYIRCAYKRCSKVSTSCTRKRRMKRRWSTVAKIRAIQRRYISRSDLCSFFRRFLSLSDKRGREELFGTAASDKSGGEHLHEHAPTLETR